MWLIISTPSNPASLMAFIFSSTEPFRLTVPHMMAFLRRRFEALATGDFLASAPNALVETAAAAMAVALVRKNSRRVSIFDLRSSHQLRVSWHGDLHCRRGCLPRQLFGHEAFFGIKGFVPGHRLA